MFKDGEEKWTNWSWKMIVAIGAMHPVMAEALKLAERMKPHKTQELMDALNADDDQRSRVTKASP